MTPLDEHGEFSVLTNDAGDFAILDSCHAAPIIRRGVAAALEFDLLRHLQRVIYFDAQIADGAFQLPVT